MNDFLDNLSKAVNETAKKAMKVSGDVVELTKTSLNIKFDEIKRESFFKEIGKITYNSYKNSPNSVSDDILDFCKCIDEIESDIHSQKSKAAQIKNKKFCVNCGIQMIKSANFCYSCGAQQPEIIEEECGCECECEDESCDCGCFTEEAKKSCESNESEEACCSEDSDSSDNSNNSNNSDNAGSSYSSYNAGE